MKNTLASFLQGAINTITLFTFSKKEKLVICVLSSVIFILYVLKFTLLGKITLADHQWLSAHASVIINNWIDHNPLYNFFSLISEPFSIESSSVNRMYVYPSYPPGAFIPPYIAAKIFNIYPRIAFIQMYSSVNQILTAVFLCLVSLNLAQNNDSKTKYIVAVMSFFVYMFSYQPSVFHFFAYFADTAVTFPVACLLFYITTVDARQTVTKKKRRFIFNILSFLIFFFGALTDPFFYVIVFVFIAYQCTCCFRNKNFFGMKKNVVILLLPCVFALIGYFIQLLYTGELNALIEKFLIRTSLKEDGYDFTIFNFINHFTYIELFFILIATTVVVLRKDVIAIIVLISCILHYCIFSEHSNVHEFSTVKFFLFLSIAQYSIYMYIRSISFKKYYFLLILVYCGVHQFHVAVHMARSEPIGIAARSVAHKVASMNYNTIAISDAYEINIFPPHLQSISRKRLWNIRDRHILANRLRDVDKKQYTVRAIIPTLTKYLEKNKEGNEYIDSISPCKSEYGMPVFWDITFKAGTTPEDAFDELQK